MAKVFKPTLIEGKPLKPNPRVTQVYRDKLEALANAMIKETEKELKKLFEKDSPAYFAQDASISSQAKILINSLINKFYKIFDIEGKSLTDTMINQANRSSKTNVKQSLESMKQGITINVDTLSEETKEILKASASEASMYIKSIQEEYLTKVSGATYRSISSGNGLKDLIPDLEKISGQTKRRVRNLAQDQTAKVMASLDKSRLNKAGITKAKWKHSGGARTEPRPTHVAMNNKIFDINEGMYDSSVGRNVQPAELPFCACYLVPVIEIGE